jgi:hypothetical protein
MKLISGVLAFAVSFGVLGVSREGMSMDKTGYYWVFHDASCGQLVDARRNKEDGPYEAWLAGYLTAMDIELPDTTNLVGSDDLSGPVLWVENWCIKNPLEPFAHAAWALVRDLYPQRQKAAPK